MNGAVAPFYLGKLKGYYDAEGIDLKLMEGHGSGPTVQAVATHNVDIGYADFSTLVKVAAMGAPVKAIGVLLQTWQRLKSADRELVIRSPNPRIRRVLQIASIEEVVRIDH